MSIPNAQSPSIILDPSIFQEMGVSLNALIDTAAVETKEKGGLLVDGTVQIVVSSLFLLMSNGVVLKVDKGAAPGNAIIHHGLHNEMNHYGILGHVPRDQRRAIALAKIEELDTVVRRPTLNFSQRNGRALLETSVDINADLSKSGVQKGTNISTEQANLSNQTFSDWCAS